MAGARHAPARLIGAPLAAPRLLYVVCTAPRTGSSLLCRALSQCGVAGRPEEYFDTHAHNETFWRRELGIADDADYLDRAVAAATTANGVAGIKLHWHQAAALKGRLLRDAGERRTDTPLHHLLQSRFGEVRYVWLRRTNVVAQAISFVRAGLTGQWRVAAGSADAQPGPDPAYDHAAIERHVKLAEQFNGNWHAFFMRQRLRALAVVYESFVEAYEPTIRGVLQYLGSDQPGLAIPPPALRKQSDGVSAAWERRFRALEAAGAEPRYTPERTARRRRRQAAAEAALPFTAYDLGTSFGQRLEPAPASRDWMDATGERFAYRCLPMVIANQAGWLVRGDHRVTAVWDGRPEPAGLRVTEEGAGQPYATSHFGSGILTFNLRWLFRTPPGYNLLVRGPANMPKDGICALDGVVETDWTQATFTMNWQLTRPGHPVTFAPGDPVAMLLPQHRGELERFRPALSPLASDPAWQAGYRAWSGLRTSFNAALRDRRPGAVAAGWQRHYLVGVNVDPEGSGSDANGPSGGHQTGLSLHPFKEPP